MLLEHCIKFFANNSKYQYAQSLEIPAKNSVIFHGDQKHLALLGIIY